MTISQEVRTMVDTNVLVSVSALINELSSDEKYMDMIFDLLSQPDFKTPARDAGFIVEDRPDGFYWSSDVPAPAADGPFTTAENAWESACDAEGIDPYINEVYEHWIVTPWLAHQLEERGEVIDHDFLGMVIWGRCATGQEIAVDAVMIDIIKTVRSQV